VQTSGPVLAAASSSADSALAHHVMGGGTPATFADGLLAGLGHPVIALDHLAAVIAVGILAASQPRGAALVIGYVLATVIGAAAHIGEATAAGAEILVALSVIALGLVLVMAGARMLFARAAFRPGMIRLLGAGIIGLGLVELVQQIASGA
jgi:urease accessory protein